MLKTITLQAGETKRFQEVGDFFRILSSTDLVTVTFYKNGSIICESEDVNPGYSEKFTFAPFDFVEIKSTNAQSVKFVIRYGNEVRYDGAVAPIGGGVQVSGETSIIQATTVNDLSPVSVGTSATALVAADATRKGIRLFNAGSADVYLGGASVTTTNGAIKIGAGATWIENEAAPAAWFGISGTAAQSIKIQEIK